MSWLAASNPCPGLFYGTSAQDGTLIRIRIPGGVLNGEQISAIVEIADRWQIKAVQVTNRANLQFRAVQSIPSAEMFETLQSVGLAAQNPELDHLRNLMASPTAGIDATEWIDVRSMIQAIDSYIQNSPELVGLPPKFSIGIDGGGQVGIGVRSKSAWQHRYNEIQLSAVNFKQFRLSFSANKQAYETDVIVQASDCVNAIAALTQAYLKYVKQCSKKARMRDLLQDWGIEKYLDQAEFQFDRCSDAEIPIARTRERAPKATQYLDVQPQKQPGLSYIGIALRLGWMSIAQLQGLIELSDLYGSGELRLTPWQAVLLPNIPTQQTSTVLEAIQAIGLSMNTIEASIVACAGKPGCIASETHTQTHALELIKHLNYPINIHITGCPKGCAQPSPAEVTLLGTTIQGVEAYSVYKGDRALTTMLADDLSTIAHLINTLHD